MLHLPITKKQQGELNKIASSLRVTPETAAMLILAVWFEQTEAEPEDAWAAMAQLERKNREGKELVWGPKEWV